ncbi:MAG: hypothetical protein WCL10_18775 [Novosphingobium sp.]|uniref:hypothetical protein n=1 Tax=Novosphingobium sp. TaxID=1874826 RepID=UPI003015952E
MDGKIPLQAYAVPQLDIVATMRGAEANRRQDVAYAQQQQAQAQAQQNAAARRGIVQLAGTDLEAARKRAFELGDPEAVTQVGKFETDNHARAAEIARGTAPALLSLRNVPHEGVDQALSQIAPLLGQYGFNADHIEQIREKLKDPAQRDGFFNQVQVGAQNYAEYAKSQEPIKLSAGEGMFVGDPNSGYKQVAGMPDKPSYDVLQGEDGTFYRINKSDGSATPISVGGGTGAPGTAGGSARSALTTNPGALKDGPFARSQPGYTGNSGGFATFANPQQGVAAQEALIQSRYIGRGLNTIDKIISTYAPQGPENSAASVANYKTYVAQRAGISPTDRITPDKVPAVAAAMREFETGNRPGGSGGTLRGKGAEKVRTLTPAEVAADPRLNPGTVYQQKPDGTIVAVSGTADKAARPIPATQEENLSKQFDIWSSLYRANTTWNPDYAGNTVTGGLETSAQRLMGTGTPGQAEWWSDFRTTDNLIRNSMFGSALTDGEKKAYEATTISESTDPKVAAARLNKRGDIITGALRRRARVLVANGHDINAVKELFGNEPMIVDGLETAIPSNRQPASAPASSNGWGKAQVVR